MKLLFPLLLGLLFATAALAQEEAKPKKKRTGSQAASTKKTTGEAASTKPAKKSASATTESEKPATEVEAPAKKKQVDQSNADADAADAASATPVKKQATPESVQEPRARAAPNATVEPDQIMEYAGLSEPVRKLIDASLLLTKQNLTYTYGSADPANGGMDCSGTIHYLLREAGFKDAPRDASGLYSWARKEGKFFAVISKKPDGFEFSDLRPGDLLFWNGTYSIDRDPPVTHVMIYLGTEKKRKKRIMVGASDGRTYDGKSRWGVSVFDFVMPRPRPGETTAKADFLGYARIPGFGGESAAPVAAPEQAEEPAADEKPVVKVSSKRRSGQKKNPPKVD
ncbi:MAG: NlpC/P60 family protein [Verrucomicrobiota bacterium]